MKGEAGVSSYIDVPLCEMYLGGRLDLFMQDDTRQTNTVTYHTAQRTNTNASSQRTTPHHITPHHITAKHTNKTRQHNRLTSQQTAPADKRLDEIQDTHKKDSTQTTHLKTTENETQNKTRHEKTRQHTRQQKSMNNPNRNRNPDPNPNHETT